MSVPSPRAIRFFRTWDRVRDRPIGRLVRGLRAAVDPLVYAAWSLTTAWSTRRPRGFNDKVRHKMLYDRRPILTLFADKARVRDYVAERIGAGYLPELYQVHEAAADVRWDELPREFAAKVTHASGGAILATASADPAVRLPDYTASGHRRYAIHPDTLDERRAEQLLDRWLAMPYGWSGWKREWAYRNVPPRIVVEELLIGPDGGIPPDYKLYVFGGRCRFVEVHRDRFRGFVVDRYTRDWEYMPFDWVGVARSGVPKPPPERFEEMVAVAETLSDGIDFVRVDLYGLADRIVFGELTHYPAGGHGRFEPPEYDELLGSWWQLPDRYR